LNAEGSLDSTFNPQANGTVRCLALQADGKILAGGYFSRLGGRGRSSIGRLTTGTSVRQALAINGGGTTVTWGRSGPGPELQQVTFELSTDGTEYTLLGRGAPISGGWQLTGLSPPVGQNFYIRARGRAISGGLNGSSGVVESLAQFWRWPPPFIFRAQVLGNDVFQFSFTNSNATAWTVLGSGNVASPVAQWDVLGSPVSLGNGIYQVTDPAATHHSRRFYRLRSP
jgi:hypothetical protein